MKGQWTCVILFLFVFTGTMCRKTYEPPAIRASNHFLAIDGIINTGANSISTFILSRSLNLLDSIPDLPDVAGLLLVPCWLLADSLLTAAIKQQQISKETAFR